MEQHTSPPSSVWETFWPLVQSALTLELVGSIFITMAATQVVKVVAPVYFPRHTTSRPKWKAFCMTTGFLIGAFSGTVVWLTTAAAWPIVPMAAFTPIFIWNPLLAILPEKVRKALVTDTDRRHGNEDSPDRPTSS